MSKEEKGRKSHSMECDCGTLH